MLLAMTKNGLRIKPKPGLEGYCPGCAQKPIPKCGIINIWHWSHHVKCEFDHKPETEWHLEWKQYALKYDKNIEVKIGNHIADVVSNNLRVVEFQNSNIDSQEIIKRSLHYQKERYHVDWIFNFSEKYYNEQLILKYNGDGDYYSFHQKYKKKQLNLLTDKRGFPKYGGIWLDFGKEELLIFVRKIYNSGNGWGYIVPKSSIFNQEMFSNVEPEDVFDE